MAQAPATPKRLRALRLLKTSTLGPNKVLSDPKLVPSERAALSWRLAPAQPLAPETVTFLIPIVGKHHVGNWDTVEHHLAQTLACFLRQTNPNWQCLLCGQDQPATLPDDPRIRFIRFTDKVEGNDKWDKLAALVAHLDTQYAPGYVMPFDADDLLHPEMVAYMLTKKSAGGYTAELGYIWDTGRRKLALAGPRSARTLGRKPLWKLCGSTVAFAWDGSAASQALLHHATQHEHRMFPYLSALAGRTLASLPFPAVTYVLNHGENFGVRRGRVNYKSKFVDRFEVTDPGVVAQAQLDFQLTP